MESLGGRVPIGSVFGGFGSIGFVESVENCIESTGGAGITAAAATGADTGDIGAVSTAVLMICMVRMGGGEITATTGTVFITVPAICIAKTGDRIDGPGGGVIGDVCAVVLAVSIDKVECATGPVLVGDSSCSGSWNGGDTERAEGARSTARDLNCNGNTSGCGGDNGSGSDFADHNLAGVGMGNVGTRDTPGIGGKGGGGDGYSADGTCFPSGIRGIRPALKDMLNGRNLRVD